MNHVDVLRQQYWERNRLQELIDRELIIAEGLRVNPVNLMIVLVVPTRVMIMKYLVLNLCIFYIYFIIIEHPIFFVSILMDFMCLLGRHFAIRT